MKFHQLGSLWPISIWDVNEQTDREDEGMDGKEGTRERKIERHEEIGELI